MTILHNLLTFQDENSALKVLRKPRQGSKNTDYLRHDKRCSVK